MKPLTVAVVLVMSLVLSMTALAGDLVLPASSPLAQVLPDVQVVETKLPQEVTTVPVLMAQEVDEGAGFTFGNIVAVVLSILVTVDIVVRITPTKKDDEMLAKLTGVLDHFGIDLDGKPKK